MAHEPPYDIRAKDLHVQLPNQHSGDVVITATGACECCAEPAEVKVTLPVPEYLELLRRTRLALARA